MAKFLLAAVVVSSVLLHAQTDRSSSMTNVLRHPLGISVNYPQDWKVRELPGGTYQLLPPGPADPEELYTISGEPANGITTAEDPRVSMILEQFVTTRAPALRRVGTMDRVRTQSAPGIGLQWEGGMNARAVVFVVVLKGAAIAVTGLGSKPKVAAREATLRQIFASFSAGEAQRDPRIVGTWNRLGTTAIDAHDAAGRLQASSAGDHHRTLLLRPDGTCASRQVDRTIANSAAVSIDTGDQVTVKNGTWFAGEGQIGLNWDKDGELYRYEVTGSPGSRRLTFKTADGTAIVWQEAR